MKKKLSLDHLEVKSFKTKAHAAREIQGGSWVCGTNFQECDTGEPLICGFATEAANCTQACTWIC